MDDLLILIGFFIFGGIFWVIKKVAEKSVRQETSSSGKSFDLYQEFDEQDPEEVDAFEEAEITQVKTSKMEPELAEKPQTIMSQSRLSAHGMTAFIRKNPDKAILLQEILGPPKGLR